MAIGRPGGVSNNSFGGTSTARAITRDVESPVSTSSMRPLSLPGSGAQCLAADPTDPDIVYAGLREGGVRRTVDGGRTWVDCRLPESGVFSLAVSAADGAVYAGTEPSRLFRSRTSQEQSRTTPCG